MIAITFDDYYSLDFVHWKNKNIKAATNKNDVIELTQKSSDIDSEVFLTINGELKGSIHLLKGYTYSIKIQKDKDATTTIKKFMSKKEAKAFLKTTFYKWSWSWDSWLCHSDLQCLVCGEWCSNPTYGRVLDKGIVGQNSTTSKNIHIYNNRVYERIDWREWYVKTFYNRSEFEEMSNYYKDHGGISERLKEWRDFDDTWNSTVKNTTQEIIDKPNFPAAGWRDTTGKVIYFERQPVIGSYEKVYSSGAMSTPNPKTVECPCCSKLYDVYALGYFMPLRLRIKDRIELLKYKKGL